MKEKSSKKKLWIILAVVLAVVIAAAATVTVILLNRNSVETDVPMDDNQIYWNVDRQYFYGKGTDGMSSRTIDKDDGYYHILLASAGRAVERKTRSSILVNRIDGIDAFGITIDEKTRAITDITPIEDMGYSYYIKRHYAVKVEGNEITLNTSASLVGKERVVKIDKNVPIYDVSLSVGDDAGLPVKIETIQKKDQISIIQNEDGSFYAVYITKRAQNNPVYWNIKREYDSKFVTTKREPDEDGVYHVLMAAEGKQVDVKSKDKAVVTAIDARADCCVGLEFDEEGYAIKMLTPTKTTGGASFGSWFDVINLEDLGVVAEKHSLTAKDDGKLITGVLDEECGVYNVSTNHEEFVGEATDLRVGDRIQGFTDPFGKIVVMFVVRRPKQADLYWNAFRMYDSTKKESTRTRAADGYFHVLMCHEGKLKEILVADQEIMNSIDSVASFSMGLDVVNGVAVKYYKVGDMYESRASWYDIQSFVEKDVIHVKKIIKATDTGKEYDLGIKEDCKIYNVTATYSDHLGEETTLRVGDRIQAWIDYTGKAKYIFVVSRTITYSETAHTKNHKCEDCGENVTWQPWTKGNSLPTESGHYYLCGDVVSPQASIAKDQDVVLCLNGYSVKASAKRIYSVHNTGASLAIHDCAGTGKMYSDYAGDIGTTQGAIIWARYGKLSIYGGTYIGPVGKTENTGPVITSQANTTVTIKNATIIGGTTSKNGGAIYIASSPKAVLNMENVTIVPGKTDTGNGNGLYMGTNSKLNLAGKIVVSGSGGNDLYLAGGALITMDENNPLAAGSKLTINTASSNGKITTNYIEGCEQYFVSSDKNKSILVSNAGYLFMGKVNPLIDHKTAHVCEDCEDEDVEWTPWTSATTLPTTSGHYYLCGDVAVDQQNVAENEHVVLCLNGFEVKGTGNRVYAVNANNAKLTLADCTGKGRMYNGKSGNLGTTQGGVIWAPKGSLSIYGGTYEANAGTTPNNGAVICADTNAKDIIIKNATIIGGATGKNGGAIYLGKNNKLYISDSTIISGKAEGNGDAISLGESAVLLPSGKVEIIGGSSQVYLTSSAYITFDGELTEGSKIGVDTESEGSVKISTNYVTGADKYIVSNKEGYTVKYMSGALYLDDGSTVIEEHKNAHTCEECGEDVEWLPWTDAKSLPITSGHYYLACDVSTTQKNVSANEDIVLCLNGHTVKGTGGRIYALREAGSLTLSDCTGVGRMYNSSTSGLAQGCVIWVQKGTLNIFGGTYEAPSATTNNNGCLISAETNPNNVTIKNATLIGGSTSMNGGVIYVGKNNKLTLNDVTIVAGKAGNNGDAIALGETATLALSGKITISGGSNQVYLGKGSYITFDGALTEGSKFGVTTTDENGKVSTNYVTNAEKYVISELSGTEIQVKDGALYVVTKERNHDEEHLCEHCNQYVTWTPWTNATALPITNGHYYLTTNVATTQKNVSANNEVILCLNGFEVKGTGNRIYALNATGAKLSLCDCVGTGRMYNNKSGDLGTTQGGVIWVPNGTLNIYGGTYEANPGTTPNNGAVICADTKPNVINIRNATLIGGATNKNGGVMYIGKSNQVSLCDVTIIAGSAKENGDAFCLGESATLSLSGKVSITGGTNQIYLGTNSYLAFDGELAEGSSLSVTGSDSTGKISSNYIPGVEEFIKSEKAGTEIQVINDMLYVVESAAKASIESANSYFSTVYSKAVNSELTILSPALNLLRKAGLK